LKFQAVAEKTAKDARGLLYFAAPGMPITWWICKGGGGRTEVTAERSRLHGQYRNVGLWLLLLSVT